MPITITNLDAGVLPANIGVSGELLPPVASTGPATTLIGDVSGAGTGTIQTAIGASVVTYAKIQNESAGTLLGNPTIAAAAPSEIKIDGGMTFSNGILLPPASVVNQFRNGAMDIAQRGASGSVTGGTTAYTLDGWQVAPTGAAAAWSQQYFANVSGNALRISCASGMSACNVQQRIESYMATKLLNTAKAAGPVTVQFAIYNNTGATIIPMLATGYASARDNFTTVTADLAATNLQQIPNATLWIVAYTFTPSTSASNGYQVQLQFGNQLNAATGYVDIGYADIRPSQSSVIGLNNSPPPPELRSVQQELALCQRYYLDPANGGSTQIYYDSVYSGISVNSGWTAIPFPVQMRASPTINFRNQNFVNTSSLTVGGSNVIGFIPQYTVSAGVMNTVQFNLTASAEL